MSDNILQYESKIWATADLLRGSGIKESEWPSMMMPFFALVMIESRLVRMFEELKSELGEDAMAEMDKDDLIDLIRDKGQGYNAFIFERNLTLKDICKNDKTFDLDFASYLGAFDGETKDLLGVDASEGEKFLDIRGVITKLKAKKVLLGYTKDWSTIDLRPFNNSEITTLEEHIKRKWADMSAETAGEQYTPDDIISLISEIIASKITESDQLLKIYDCTCGGGNLLFGVEDRIKQKFKRFTATYGQDWNDALYAMARIESRFRSDSKIEYGNTLNHDKFSTEEFDVATANPPYGVDWKGYAKSIEDDKTGRFHYLPSTSDGQLLFMQHIIAKLNASGLAVVVHNGSSLFSGDAGSAESNIRKWMLDNDLVEAVIQNPTSEFFNTGIFTYLWVINKNKPAVRKDQVLLIDASKKFTPLKKPKGDKRNEIDAANRAEIVEALNRFEDCAFARRFSKYHFYFNKQAIELTNLDADGRTFGDRLPMVTKRDGTEEKAKSETIEPVLLTNGEVTLSKFTITTFDQAVHGSLYEAFDQHWKPLIAALDYREQPLEVTTTEARYHFDLERETLVKTTATGKEALGCGRIVVKAALKTATKKLPERIEITVELTPDTEKDAEIIPFDPDPAVNQAAIAAFMEKHITRTYIYLDNIVGVEINFPRIFFAYEAINSVPLAWEIFSKVTHKVGDVALLASPNLFKPEISDDSCGQKTTHWIGSLPKGWGLVRFKDLFKERSAKGRSDLPLLIASQEHGVILKEEYTRNTVTAQKDLGALKVVEIGDFVISLRAFEGGIEMAHRTGIISSAYTVIRLKDKSLSEYYRYLFKSSRFIALLASYTTGIREGRNISYKDLKQIMIPVPPVDLRQSIPAGLDKVRNMQDVLYQQIDALEKLYVAALDQITIGKISLDPDL